MLACSVVSREYAAHLRVLADSLLAADPEARLAVCVVDDPDGDVEVHEAVELVRPAELGVDRRELHRLALIYGAHGLASTIKPRMLRHLVERGEPSALLLDADICVYTPLRDLDTLAREHGLVLSPQLRRPARGPDGPLAESKVLATGTFNSGCVGVSAAAGPFLDWWASRTARDCVEAREQGRFFEQLWLSLVPGMFPYHVLEDPGLNVFGAQLGGQDVSFEDGVPILEDGVRVRFFHFLCGFDPYRPQFLSPAAYEDGWPGWPRPGQHSGIERLCADYAERLIAAGFAARQTYRYTVLPDGTALDGAMRAAYRRGLLDSERGRGPEPPNPFMDGTAEPFLDWLRQPPQDWPDEPVPRYVLGLRDARSDLRVICSEVPGRHTRALLGWVARASGWGEPIWEGLNAGEGGSRSPERDLAAGAGRERQGRALANARESARSLREQLDNVYASRSWRLTQPLRRVAALVGRSHREPLPPARRRVDRETHRVANERRGV